MAQVRAPAQWPPAWPPLARLRDERLAFLAAQPELVRRTTTVRRRLGRGFTRLGRPMTWVNSHARVGRRQSPQPGQQPARPAAPGGVPPLSSALMRHYVLAVETVADRLSVPERADLRASGRLPEWFFDAVEEERRRLERTWRGG